MFIPFISQTEHFSEIKINIWTESQFSQNYQFLRLMFSFANHKNIELSFVFRSSGTKGKDKIVPSLWLWFQWGMQVPLVTKWRLINSSQINNWSIMSKYSFCPNPSAGRLFGILILSLRTYLGLERGYRPPTMVRNKWSQLVQIQVLKTFKGFLWSLGNSQSVLDLSLPMSRGLLVPGWEPWAPTAKCYWEVPLERPNVWFSSFWTSPTWLPLLALKADQIKMLLLAIREAFFFFFFLFLF